ncbi:hypothetical protein ZIOFF_004886 [Zingiber officinale]|uniref:Uncharacterized protein n=1 Tax=Zingiber officinale TaxID=94328 RepID=A0A8J5LM76_ZINOF|nr:hypothetical protein ZIOFF_004886 [Zingiber officinale]
MASRFQSSHSSFLFLLLLLSSSLPHSLASSKKPPAAARKGDIPFIKCQVCEKISHQIIHQVKKKESQISPKKVSELQIIEIAENICNLKKEESDWILQIDLVEKGDKLELIEQGVEGLCNSECKTIERACQEFPTQYLEHWTIIVLRGQFQISVRPLLYAWYIRNSLVWEIASRWTATLAQFTSKKLYWMYAFLVRIASCRIAYVLYCASPDIGQLTLCFNGHNCERKKRIWLSSCQILGYTDTDVAEFVYSTRPSVDQLINFLCKDLSKACSVKPHPLPADRIAGEAFVAKPAKEAEMDKILRSMEGMPGAPGMKMYSREDLMSGKFGGSEEDDDEDEEDDLSEKLGNILKSKDSPKRDYKQKLLQGFAETGTAIKRHISKVSKHAKSLWRKFTKGSSPAKAKKIDL